MIAIGFVEEKSVSFTVDIGATMSIVRSDIVNHLQPQLTIALYHTDCTWSSVKLLGSYQPSDLIIIMSAYVFLVDLRENFLRVGQEKIRFYMPKLTGSVNHYDRLTL